MPLMKSGAMMRGFSVSIAGASMLLSATGCAPSSEAPRVEVAYGAHEYPCRYEGVPSGYGLYSISTDRTRCAGTTDNVLDVIYLTGAPPGTETSVCIIRGLYDGPDEREWIRGAPVTPTPPMCGSRPPLNSLMPITKR